MVITTEQEKHLANHQKILVLHGENELNRLVENVKVFLLGKEAYKKIVVGVYPGVAVGVIALADGKVIEEGNCFSTKELIDSILKIIRNVDFAVTNVSAKMGIGGSSLLGIARRLGCCFAASSDSGSGE